MAEYPTEEQLSVIEKSSPQSEHEFLMLLSVVEEAFNASYGLWDYKGTKSTIKLHLATGGWSGNEDVINAMEKNIYLQVGWLKSVRGGGYWYEWNLKTFFKNTPPTIK